jgi:hypothetical protein
MNDKPVKLSGKEFVEEHTHLVRVLRKGGRKSLKTEARKQARELGRYRGR